MPTPTCCPFCHSDEIAPFRGKYRCFICGREFSAEGQTTEPTFTPLRLFISYGHTEHPICRKIADALIRRGHEVWFDKDQLHEGLNWRKEIVAGLEKSNGVVACISDHYVRPRSVCMDELSIAIGVTRGEHVHTVLLGDESIVPTSLCYNQWLDMRDWEERLNGDQAAFEQWFQANMQKLFAMLETEDNRAFSGAIQTLQEKLQVSPNTSRQSSLLKKPFMGRQWLTNQVVAWLDDPNGERLCFLSGDPGVGKSAFAANFTHYNPRVAAALFCWAGENRFNDPRAVLKMLAFLLACRIPDYRARLLLRLDGEDRLGEYNERELFRVLLEEPLHGLIDGGRETLCIVIDGLDEAGTAEENLLAETLGRYMPLLPRWLRVLVTARQVAAVTQPLGSGRQMALDGKSQENLADVRQYFEETLRDCCAETPDWQASLDELTRHSHGIFLYAELVCQGILAGKLALTDWDRFPDGLEDAFTRWFQWFFPDRREFEAQFALPLGALCVLAEPLPLEELRRVFGWNESQLHRFLRRIDVLLDHGESVFGKETITLSHKYIGEWLTDPHLNSLYFVSVSDAKEAMAGAFYDRFQKDPKGLTELESLHLCDLLEDCGKTAEWREAVCSSDLCWNIFRAGDYCQGWGHLDEAMKCYRCAMSVTERGKSVSEDLILLYNSAAYIGRIGGLEQSVGNHAVARNWYEKGMTIAKWLTENPGTQEDWRNLSLSYNNLGDLALEDGDRQAARDWYEKSLDIAKRVAKNRAMPEDQLDLGDIFNRLGDLAREDGNQQAARDWYEKSLSIREQLAESRGIPEDQLGFGDIYNRLGSLAWEDGKWQVARNWYEKTQAIAERRVKTRGTPRDHWNLSRSYNKQGDLAKKAGDRQAAQDWYEKALAIAEQVPEVQGTPEERRSLSICYNKLGDLALDDGDLQTARNWYKKFLDFAEWLVENRGTPGDQRDLSLGCERMGVLARKAGDLRTAWDWYEKELFIAKRLAEICGTPRNQGDLRSSYNKLGNLAKEEGDRQAARDWYEKGLAIAERLKNTRGAPEDWRGLSISYESLGDLAKEEGDRQAARDWYEKALAIAERLAKTCDTPENSRDLGVSYNNLGDLAHKEGNRKEARDWYEKAMVIRERLAETRGTPEDRRDLSVSYNRLGNLAREAGDWQTARDLYKKSMAITEWLVETRNTPEVQRDLSVNYEMLGASAKEEGDRQAAWEWFEKALAIREQLAGTRGTPEDQRTLSNTYNHLGNLAREAGDRQTAQSWYEKAMVIRERLAKTPGTPEDQRDLSNSYAKLGGLALKAGERQVAREWFSKELAITQQLVEKSGASNDYDAMIASLYKLANVPASAQEQFRLAQRGIDISERLYQQTGLSRHQKLLTGFHKVLDNVSITACEESITYDRKGDSALKNGDQQAARKWYEKALDIRERLVKDREKPDDWRNLSVSYHKLGDLALEDGDRQAAYEWYKKALIIRERLAKAHKTVSDYSNLADILYKLATISASQQEQTELAKRGLPISDTLYQQTALPKYFTYMEGFSKMLKPKRRGFFGRFFGS